MAHYIGAAMVCMEMRLEQSKGKSKRYNEHIEE